MSFLKRAYLYTTRKKIRTGLLFSIILIISTLLIVCFSINSSTDIASANVKKSLKSGFTINAKTLNDGLNNNDIEKILNIDGLTEDYNLRNYTTTYYKNEEKEKLKTRDDTGIKVYDNADRVVSDLFSEKDTYFTDEGFKLIEGEPITPDTKYSALIHKDFAEENNLGIGDSIILENIEGNEVSVKVKIIGIFTSTRKSSSESYMDTTNLFENIIFTDLQTSSELIYESDDLKYQYGDFIVEDPQNLDKIIDDVKEVDSVEWDKCKITKDDSTYQNVKESLESLQSIVSVAITVIFIISIVLIILILNLWTKHRVYEIGVLLSIGINKLDIIKQQIVEIFMVSIPAFLFSFITSSIVNQMVSSKLIEDISNSIKVTVNISDWLIVSILGLLIIIVATILSIIQITRIEPRDIFSELNYAAILNGNIRNKGFKLFLFKKE